MCGCRIGSSARGVFHPFSEGKKEEKSVCPVCAFVCAPKAMQSDFISIMSLLGVVLIRERFCQDIYGLNCCLNNIVLFVNT